MVTQTFAPQCARDCYIAVLKLIIQDAQRERSKLIHMGKKASHLTELIERKKELLRDARN